MQRNARTRTNKTEQNKKIVHLDAVKIDCTTILCDESQDLNASHVPSGKRIPQETQRPCRYPPAKEFHKRHKQMNRMCEHSQKFGKCLMLNKMCSCWGRDTALHHMSSLLTSFLRHMLRHSHVTIMKIVHLDAVKIDCVTILCDECQDLNASHAPSGKRIPQETQRLTQTNEQDV